MTRRETLPKHDLIAVVWYDAHSFGNDELSQEAAETKHEPVRTVSIGWLIKSDETGVSIAPDLQEWPEHFDQADHTTWRDGSFIPRGMVAAEIPLAKKSTGRKADHSAKKSRKAAKTKINDGSNDVIGSIDYDSKVMDPASIPGEAGRTP